MLRRVRAARPDGAPVLRAELAADSGGSVTIVWFGRDHITGIEPGRMIAVEGTLSTQRGRSIIYNPKYEFVDAGVEHREQAGPVHGAA